MIGILGDKDFRGIIRQLVPLADQVIVTRPDYARALDLDSLAAEVRKLHGSVETAPGVGEAIKQARERSGPGDMVLVTGSLYVVGDARAALLGRRGQDPGAFGIKGIKGGGRGQSAPGILHEA